MAKYWTDKDQQAAAKILQLYQESDCSDVKLRDLFLSVVNPIMIGSIHNSLRRRINQNTDDIVDDLKQDCWIKIVEVLPKIDYNRPIFQYLTSVCNYTCLAKFKKYAVRKKYESNCESLQEREQYFKHKDGLDWGLFIEALKEIVDDELMQFVDSMIENPPRHGGMVRSYLKTLGMTIDQRNRLLGLCEAHSFELRKACLVDRKGKL